MARIFNHGSILYQKLVLFLREAYKFIMILKKCERITAGLFPVEVHFIQVFPGSRREEMTYVLSVPYGFADET